MSTTSASTLPETLPPQALDAWFDQRFAAKMAEREAAKVPAMTIIATKGTLDMAYPPFILASTAAALGWEVSIHLARPETAGRRPGEAAAAAAPGRATIQVLYGSAVSGLGRAGMDFR